MSKNPCAADSSECVARDTFAEYVTEWLQKLHRFGNFEIPGIINVSIIPISRPGAGIHSSCRISGRSPRYWGLSKIISRTTIESENLYRSRFEASGTFVLAEKVSCHGGQTDTSAAHQPNSLFRELVTQAIHRWLEWSQRSGSRQISQPRFSEMTQSRAG
jgi:hypothetical protein